MLFHIIEGDICRDVSDVAATLCKELLSIVLRCNVAWVKFVVNKLVR